uniref:Uncharacterized protein n=1 Tax=Rhizophagus irregularis (strain DAOM 181602 / DAOM 197198 / MUCL 43194) TaxID=747089 RepID=U9TLS4_RHIID
MFQKNLYYTWLEPTLANGRTGRTGFRDVGLGRTDRDAGLGLFDEAGLNIDERVTIPFFFDFIGIKPTGPNDSAQIIINNRLKRNLKLLKGNKFSDCDE